MKCRALSALLIAGLPCLCYGLGPHEVLLLVNDRSPDSVAVAREYADMRRIPESNVVRLDLGAAGAKFEITPGDFESLIWTPAQAAMRARKIDDHVLAWVYSVGFPCRIGTSPALSIQGITFLRNRLPDPKRVETGTVLSPLFAGPQGDGEGNHYPMSLDLYAEWLKRDMPLPSMMLGYMGERGNSRAQILKILYRGAGSDSTAPTGTVFFVTGPDVRSKCREWQFPAVQAELGLLKVKSTITPTFPRGTRDVMGLMMGVEAVDPEQGNTYLAGCMAEHLTSAAADFPAAHQTKLSAWIEAGASLSCGAVTEPYAIWRKFPQARFFVHYAAGCTAMESYFQAIQSPVQILLVGDPLAKPWAPAGSVEIRPTVARAEAGGLILSLELRAQPLDGFREIRFFVDGVAAKGTVRTDTGPIILPGRYECRIEAGAIPRGRHRVRAVAYQAGLVRHQVFGETTIDF